MSTFWYGHEYFGEFFLFYLFFVVVVVVVVVVAAWITFVFVNSNKKKDFKSMALFFFPFP